MQEQTQQARALLSVIRNSLWLPLLVLPGLFSTTYASANLDLLNLSSSQNSQQNIKLAQQRKLFQEAQKAYKKRLYHRFRKLSAKLEDYPLQPYLEYKALMYKPEALSSNQIHNFLQENEDTVIGNRFRSALIKHAARSQNWQRLIDIYRPNYGTSAQCQYLNALIKTNQKGIAYPKIENLWLSARSLPKSCDTVFNQWAKEGHKTPQVIWQRFTLAMSVNNKSLASYLIKSLPAKDATIARKWLKIHKKPQLVNSAEMLNIQHPDKSAILQHGLKRLSYRDITQAITLFHELKQDTFNEQQNAELVRHFGLRLARQHMPDAAIWLARIPDSHVDKTVKEWRIRTAIRQGDWDLVLNSITQLDTDKQADYRWQYWWAYANEQLGNTDDASGIYQYLANKRSYYGFLAADHLNQPYAFEDKPVEPTVDVINIVSQQPETLRAREFYIMGEIIPARREWHKLISNLDTEQKLAASKIAQAWNWHDRAIVTMGKTRYRDDIELRFPLHLDKKVFSWSKQRKIEPAWTYAIIRRESAFMSDARSSVGAMGLMQLMPNTARQIARQLKIRYRGRHSLLTSNTNISLGTGYLERMLNKLDQQQVLATAAYNAGPHRVEKWLPEHHKMDAIRWIETIPFSETREYVSNVLAYMAIYEHRMDKQITRLSHRMPPIPARNPQLPAVAITEAVTPAVLPTPADQAHIKNSNDPS
ncbi:MAG: transglycosylase SLT domain-containing protein [Gammaproteobacteria bacterium]|nr:transglycosylase SLT domain-containing protein [Gammaproteobacteria bacterium]